MTSASPPPPATLRLARPSPLTDDSPLDPALNPFEAALGRPRLASTISSSSSVSSARRSTSNNPFRHSMPSSHTTNAELSQQSLGNPPPRIEGVEDCEPPSKIPRSYWPSSTAGTDSSFQLSQVDGSFPQPSSNPYASLPLPFSSSGAKDPRSWTDTVAAIGGDGGGSMTEDEAEELQRLERLRELSRKRAALAAQRAAAVPTYFETYIRPLNAGIEGRLTSTTSTGRVEKRASAAKESPSASVVAITPTRSIFAGGGGGSMTPSSKTEMLRLRSQRRPDSPSRPGSTSSTNRLSRQLPPPLPPPTGPPPASPMSAALPFPLHSPTVPKANLDPLQEDWTPTRSTFGEARTASGMSSGASSMVVSTAQRGMGGVSPSPVFLNWRGECMNPNESVDEDEDLPVVEISRQGRSEDQHRLSALDALEGRIPSATETKDDTGLSALTSSSGGNILPVSTPFSPTATPPPIWNLTSTQQDILARFRQHQPAFSSLLGPSDFPSQSTSSSAVYPFDAYSSSRGKRNLDAPSLASSHSSAGHMSGTRPRHNSVFSSRRSSTASYVATPTLYPPGLSRTPSRIRQWEASLSLARLARRADRLVENLDAGQESRIRSISASLSDELSSGSGRVHSAKAGARRSGGVVRRESSRSWLSGGGNGGSSSRRSIGREFSSNEGGDFLELTEDGGDDNHPPSPSEADTRRMSMKEKALAFWGAKVEDTVTEEPEPFPSSEEKARVVVIGYGEDEPRVVVGPPHRLQETSEILSSGGGRQGISRKIKMAIFMVVVISIALLIGLLAGLITRRQEPSNNGGPADTGASSNCASGFLGAFCDLKSTCVCTSSDSSDCLPLALSLIDLAGSASTLFNTTIAPISLAAIFNSSQSSGDDCSTQAHFSDLGHGFDPSRQKERLAFARAALVWHLAQTESRTIVSDLQSQFASINLSGIPDGPFTLTGAQKRAVPAMPLRIVSAGWVFDLAALGVEAPVQDWVASSSANMFQQTLVGEEAVSALTRVTSLAAASSAQSESAIQLYWKNTLSLDLSQLPTFIDAIRNAPILLPFDATYPSLIALAQRSNTSFPPPLSCYSLTEGTSSLVRSYEASVFGLAPPSTIGFASDICVSSHNRPVYGLVNLLRLRQPFLSSRSSVPRQATVINEDAKVRVVVHSGELFSALPTSSSSSLSVSDDPRMHGTTLHLNHVLLDYLRAFPSPDLARELVAFVLVSSQSRLFLPPPPTAAAGFPLLATALNRTTVGAEAIPQLGAVLLGKISVSNLNYTISALATAPGERAFFASTEAAALRDWAAPNGAARVSTLSPSVVWSSDALFSERESGGGLIVDWGVGASTSLDDVFVAAGTDQASEEEVIAALTRGKLFVSSV